jgi:hypothetical protein
MSEETSTSNSERKEAAPGNIEKRSGLSDAQLAARRENAKKSTGPRTFAGKMRSSRNAVKHGRYCGQTALYSRALYGRMQELGENADDFCSKYKWPTPSATGAARRIAGAVRTGLGQQRRKRPILRQGHIL